MAQITTCSSNDHHNNSIPIGTFPIPTRLNPKTNPPIITIKEERQGRTIIEITILDNWELITNNRVLVELKEEYYVKNQMQTNEGRGPPGKMMQPVMNEYKNPRPNPRGPKHHISCRLCYLFILQYSSTSRGVKLPSKLIIANDRVKSQ